jgi:hypothetical protein
MPYRTAPRVLVAVLLFLPTASLAAQPAGDTQADLQKLLDAKQYKALLPKLSAALALRGPAAAGYDRYQLYMMKGEACLQTRAKSAAMDAFRQAAKLTSDHDALARATADAVLAREVAGNMTYTPKTGFPRGDKPEPIDILASDDGRKSAFEALEQDLLAKAKPRVEAAKKSTSLPMIMEAARGLSDIGPVEFMADGGDGDVSALLGDLGNQVCKLMDDDMDHTVDQLNGEIEYLNSHAEREPLGQLQPVLVTLGRDSRTGDNEVTQVRNVAAQMPKVFGAVTDFKPTEERAAKLEKQLAEIRHELREAHIPGVDS